MCSNAPRMLCYRRHVGGIQQKISHPTWLMCHKILPLLFLSPADLTGYFLTDDGFGGPVTEAVEYSTPDGNYPAILG